MKLNFVFVYSKTELRFVDIWKKNPRKALIFFFVEKDFYRWLAMITLDSWNW